MLNYQNLNDNDLAAIINNRNHTVITIDQLTANNVGSEINRAKKFSMANISKEEVNHLLEITTLSDEQDKKSLWNAFLILAYYNSADILYMNTNDVDCIFDITFKIRIKK